MNRSLRSRKLRLHAAWIGLSIAAWMVTPIRPSDPALPLFRDIASETGLEVVVDNSETEQKYQIEPMIAGVALFDFDNDGRLDLYLCNGAQIPGLKKTSSRFYNRLLRNAEGLRWVDVTETAGIQGEGYSMGVAAGDYDNDGWRDLYVTGVNRNILYRNRGNGRFENVTERAGVNAVLPERGKLWSVGAGWFDYDLDGDLDLFVVNYCVWRLEADSGCGADKPGYRTYCHPRLYDPLPNLLYRNNGDGTFTDVSVDSGIADHLGKGMGVAFADYDRDGYPDVFVANDAWRNFLFRNRGDGTFEEVALQSGVAYIDSGRPVSGMGADFRDYDGDGLPDIFMTALSNETFPLFRNLGTGLFRDVRFSSGLGTQSLAWGGWSTGMVDFNNDTWLDLFVAGGHVQNNEELYTNRLSRQSNRLFLNRGAGSFSDVTSDCGVDFQQIGLHRGAAFGDLDNDGRVDAVVTRLNQPVEVFRNETSAAGHYLILDLIGKDGINRDAIGAEISARLAPDRILKRHSTTAVGYGGSSDRRIHLGLGSARKVELLEITWPGGETTILKDVSADQILRIEGP